MIIRLIAILSEIGLIANGFIWPVLYIRLRHKVSDDPRLHLTRKERHQRALLELKREDDAYRQQMTEQLEHYINHKRIENA